MRAVEPGAAPGKPEALEALRLALTGHQAIGAALGATPPSVMKRRLDQLREQHERGWPMVHGSQYSDLAPLVADLVPDLEQASRASGSPEQVRFARVMLTDTYQAVSAMMAKLGELAAAWVAADLAFRRSRNQVICCPTQWLS